MSRKVTLAIPSLSGRPDLGHQKVLLDSILELKAAGHSVRYRPIVGDSIISRTRNYLVADFLASGDDDLIFIDDDLMWEEGALLRLLSHPVDLVGGVYPKRQDQLEFPVRRKHGATPDMKTGLLEVELLPTGFLRMTRTCLERMVQAYPETRYFDRHHPEVDFYALFWINLGLGLEPNDKGLPEIWGEDFTFCKRWRDIGGQVWLDTLLAFSHIGRKQYWGRYADSLAVASFFAAAE